MGTPISIVDQEEKQNTITAQSSFKTSIEFGDPRSPSNQIPRTPISSKNVDDKSSCEVLDVGQISDNQQESFPFDPRSPSTEFTRTPLSVDANKPKGLTNQSILDPRSPSVDVTRTPLVLSTAEKEDQVEEIPDTTSDAKCTPKRSSVKLRGNLRRNVLLSNTMAPFNHSSNTKQAVTEDDESISNDGNNKLDDYDEISQILSGPEDTLNFSMEATIGSDDEAFDLLSISDAHTENEAFSELDSSDVISSLKNATISQKQKLKKSGTVTASPNANSLPSQPIFYEDPDSNISSKKINDLKSRKKSAESPSSKSKQSNRTPLGFLGGENSPDIKRLSKPLQGDRASRLPRYRGNGTTGKIHADSPLYNNSSPLPLLKAGKEN